MTPLVSEIPYLNLMIKSIVRIFLIILGIDVIIFIIGRSIGLNDKYPQPFLDALYWIFGHILSFPLWLIYPQYPFSIDKPVVFIILAVANNIMLSFLVWFILKLAKRLFKMKSQEYS
jgi:hypothetical protein